VVGTIGAPTLLYAGSADPIHDPARQTASDIRGAIRVVAGAKPPSGKSPQRFRSLSCRTVSGESDRALGTGGPMPDSRSMKGQLIGTWTLVSWERRDGNGTKDRRFGENPVGIAFFDASDRYVITVMRPDRAKYASHAPWQGTAEEYKATAEGTMTYFGTYSANEADNSIAIHIDGCSFPNWNDGDQKRGVAISGDQLTLTVHPPTGEIVEVIWKRAN